MNIRLGICSLIIFTAVFVLRKKISEEVEEMFDGASG